ncbi:MAG: helix-hairpin-helix domain-containing protein [Bacteroidetes bacterium]|nr:helix-hairpin-helix domain-containing protein [Bacteroidota bacterium]
MDIRKMKKQAGRIVGDYLTYNRTEQRGVFVLGAILLCVIIANAVIPAGTFQKTPNFSAFSKEVRAFETAWKKAADSDSIARDQRYRNYRGRVGVSSYDSFYNKSKPAKPLLMVELNSADTFELQQLRGIGPGFARRIVNYRDRLGGYCDKHQVLEVFGMDSARYLLIEKNLRVNPDSIHPLDLNLVTFKELLHHPYFPFVITKNIMIYRQKNKRFKTLEELKNIQGVSDSLFRRMIIYLRLGP